MLRFENCLRANKKKYQRAKNTIPAAEGILIFFFLRIYFVTEQDNQVPQGEVHLVTVICFKNALSCQKEVNIPSRARQ